MIINIHKQKTQFKIKYTPIGLWDWPKSTTKKDPVRRLFKPEAFHTQNYKKLYNNVRVLLINWPTPVFFGLGGEF